MNYSSASCHTVRSITRIKSNWFRCEPACKIGFNANQTYLNRIELWPSSQQRDVLWPLNCHNKLTVLDNGGVSRNKANWYVKHCACVNSSQKKKDSILFNDNPVFNYMAQSLNKD